MKHTILTVFLTLGMIGGLASGFHHMKHKHHHGDLGHHSHFKHQVADICVAAAKRTFASERDAAQTSGKIGKE